jgi:hypothetical protein
MGMKGIGTRDKKGKTQYSHLITITTILITSQQLRNNAKTKLLIHSQHQEQHYNLKELKTKVKVRNRSKTLN